MRHGSLFSGIGGFDLAAQWMGWQNIFHCEWAEFPRKVLKKNFPHSISYADITKTDFTKHRGEIDIISGGFPCQPFSSSGKRKGTEDDRHLWPEMLRAIKEIQPAWVVGENVPGLLSWERGMVLAEIYTDMEVAGFEVFPPVILPACGKNAPHRRDRLWIVAHSNEIQRQSLGVGGTENIKQQSQKIGSKNWGDFELVGDRTAFTGWRSSATGFIPQPLLCRGGYGVPDWMDRFGALGNAIVPQVAYEVFKAINLCHHG